MLSLRPARHMAARVLGSAAQDITAAARDRWTVAPSERCFVPPALCLPGQLDRIEATEFAPVADVVRHLRGGYEVVQPETLGYRISHVDLVRGTLYARSARRTLRGAGTRWPAYRRPRHVTRGALYESWVGNRWFGNWLSDDCLTYRLAESVGTPIATAGPGGGHVPDYEKSLGLSPTRVQHVHFEELFLFDDGANNANKAMRAQALRERLVAGRPFARHAGVFLLRGGGGDLRQLVNEARVAELLARERGFLILDPSSSTLAEIVDACAGARIVAGVEGSHLVHGIVAMAPGAALLVIQPPDRVVSALKILTDRRDQGFAFLVGSGRSAAFSISESDVLKTTDLIS